MTKTDRVYTAVVETMKKYGIEQAIGALEKYVTEGNCKYFTSNNGARQIIDEIGPADVMQDALISTLKYNIIAGQNVSSSDSNNLNKLIIQTLEKDVGDTLNMLATNPALLNQFLGQYASIVCNNREALNAISNAQFTQINNYFLQFNKTSLEQ